MIRVLFVCLGNICRSPMAEALFMDQVRESGLHQEICADSAATSRWETGSPPHPGTQRILAARKISYDHRARTVTRSDLERFDYIIPMDDENYAAILEMGPAVGVVAPLMRFSRDYNVTEVPDPYYTGEFEYVCSLISSGVEGLLAEIRSKHGLYPDDSRTSVRGPRQ